MNMHWDVKRLYADMLELLYMESGSINTGELFKTNNYYMIHKAFAC